MAHRRKSKKYRLERMKRKKFLSANIPPRSGSSPGEYLGNTHITRRLTYRGRH